MQESATTRSPPSPKRSPTARANEAVPSSFDLSDGQLALARDEALPAEAVAAIGQRGDCQEVPLDSEEDTEAASLE